MTLNHQSSKKMVALERRTDAVNTKPSGTYTGTKKVLTTTVTAKVTVLDDTHMDFDFEGPLSIKCKNEQYKYDGDKTITLPTSDKKGDCIHDALADHGGTIHSITYDSSADSIDINVTILNFLTIDMTLNHQSSK